MYLISTNSWQKKKKKKNKNLNTERIISLKFLRDDSEMEWKEKDNGEKNVDRSTKQEKKNQKNETQHNTHTHRRRNETTLSKMMTS